MNTYRRRHIHFIRDYTTLIPPPLPSPHPPKHQKARKKQQRLEKQQQKDVERDAQRRAASYTLRVQDILNSMDDEAKENFRTGSGGAVVGTV